MRNSYLSYCRNCILTYSTYYDGNPTICCYQGFNLAIELLPWKQSLRNNKDLLTLIACLSLNVVLSSTELFNYQQALLLTLKSKCDKIWHPIRDSMHGERWLEVYFTEKKLLGLGIPSKQVEIPDGLRFLIDILKY